jgi:hypothetical protein
MLRCRLAANMLRCRLAAHLGASANPGGTVARLRRGCGSMSRRDRERMRSALDAVRHLDRLTRDLLFKG